MKKLLTSLLCVMMIVCFMPSMAWATDAGTNTSGENPTTTPSEQVVYVGEAGDDTTGTGAEATPYKTLEKALTVAQDGTKIVLKSNISMVGETIATSSNGNVLTGVKIYDKNLEIDLNGNTISHNTYYGFDIKNSDVTMSNGTLTGSDCYNVRSGKLSLNHMTVETTNSAIPIWVGGSTNSEDAKKDYTVVEIDSDSIIKSPNSYGLVVANSGQDKYGIKVNISGTTFESKDGLYVNGNYDEESDITFNIDNGAKIGGNIGIHAAGRATWNLNDAEITSGTAIYIKSGIVNIKGGNYTGTKHLSVEKNTNEDGTIGYALKPDGSYVDIAIENQLGTWGHFGNGAFATGDAIVLEACDYPGDKPELNISGGNFTSENADAVAYYKYKDAEGHIYEATKEKFITGGTFSSDVKQFLASNYTQNSSGTVVYVPPYIPPAPPADNVTNSGTTGTDNATTTADINTTASNGTASAVVDQTTADKIVKKATDNKSSEVVVDAKTSAGTAANTAVTLPTDTVQKIADQTEAEVTVKTDAAEVTLDQKAVEAVATKATGSDVQIVVEKTKDETKEMEFELKVVSGGVEIGEFDGGNVKVTVKLNATLAALKDAVLTCVHIADNGTYTKVGGAKNNDGTYTFTTTHFSSYAIMAEEEADKVIDEQTLETVKNTKLVAHSEMSKAKGKKAVKVYWNAKDGSELNFDGYEVYRSLKRYEGFGTKPFFETTKTKYYNTSIKKGTRYYYKVRGYKMINGEKAYTEYSTKAWRTVK